jgi:hypothetical protein
VLIGMLLSFGFSLSRLRAMFFSATATSSG